MPRVTAPSECFTVNDKAINC